MESTVPRHIVATDDDPKMLSLVTKTLRDAGYTVFALYNGLSACQATTSLAVLDLLITNSRMADLGAPELIRRVRQVKPDLLILHLGDPLPAGDAALAGVPGLREPYTPERLLMVVGELLGETPQREWGRGGE